MSPTKQSAFLPMLFAIFASCTSSTAPLPISLNVSDVRVEVGTSQSLVARTAVSNSGIEAELGEICFPLAASLEQHIADQWVLVPTTLVTTNELCVKSYRVPTGVSTLGTVAMSVTSTRLDAGGPYRISIPAGSTRLVSESFTVAAP